jgi:hypothetical protein
MMCFLENRWSFLIHWQGVFPASVATNVTGIFLGFRSPERDNVV